MYDEKDVRDTGGDEMSISLAKVVGREKCGTSNLTFAGFHLSHPLAVRGVLKTNICNPFRHHSLPLQHTMPDAACWPCRERKVKCDSAVVGVPCSRCRTSDIVNDCFVPAKQKRKIRKVFKRTRTRRGAALQSEQLGLASTSEDVERTDGFNRSTISDGADTSLAPGEHPIHCERQDHMTISLPSNDVLPGRGSFEPVDAVLSEENEDDVLARVCQKIASGKEHESQTASARTWTESIEYQNNFNATGILGEVMANRNPVNRLIRINHGISTSMLNGQSPKTRRDVELLGLDEADRAFLSSKGAFDVPPASVWYVEPPGFFASRSYKQ